MYVVDTFQVAIPAVGMLVICLLKPSKNLTFRKLFFSSVKVEYCFSPSKPQLLT